MGGTLRRSCSARYSHRRGKRGTWGHNQRGQWAEGKSILFLQKGQRVGLQFQSLTEFDTHLSKLTRAQFDSLTSLTVVRRENHKGGLHLPQQPHPHLRNP
jgi:hypothetical protein